VEDDLLASIKQTAMGSKTSAVRGFSKLMNIVRLANFQRDPVLYLVYLVLQLFLLWDFRVLKLLEAWKSEFGTSVADWFHALGRCEACISAATLADEYPRWCFPTSISEATSPASTSDESQAGELLFDAEEFGHPLLQDEARVVNSFQIHADRPLVVVTGSNMAGKSTFLRSIGLNVVLSRTGAPVCAQRFRTPTLELASSIRIRDSLSDGVSFFMAELKRLKQVVDSAQLHDERAQASKDAPRLMFLLDEILQGTNSQERQIAVATVLQQLLRFNAIGLISTHDLDLAHAPEVQDISQVVHFREYFEEEEGKEVMKFDYRMRPGPTPTTNALKLLQFVGLQSMHEDSL
jgi:DNA mismatch repair ATPase MutS